MKKIITLLCLLPCPLFAAVGSWNGVAFTGWNGVAQTSWNGTGVSCAGGSDFTTGLVTWYYAPDLTNANHTIITTWTNRVAGSLATYVQGDAYKEAALINGVTGFASTNLPQAAVEFPAADVTSFTVMWVGRVISEASEGGLFSHRVIGGNGFALPGDGGTAYRPHLVTMNSGGETVNRRTASIIAVPTPVFLITWTWNGTTSFCYTNGVEDTSNEAGGAGYGINIGQIGRSYNDGVMHTGEIRVYNSVLSGGNRGTAETFMKTTWGIP